jgi:hypothetical protein
MTGLSHDDHPCRRHLSPKIAAIKKSNPHSLKMKPNPRTSQTFFTLLAHRERGRDWSNSLRGRMLTPERKPAPAAPQAKAPSLTNPVPGRP